MARDDRLRKLRKLFDGDHREYFDATAEMEVAANWFRRTALFWADLMLAYPPEVIGLEDSVWEAVRPSLLDALYEAVVDMVRYGVGLLRGRAEVEGGPVVDSVDPRSWYPLPGYTGDVVLSPMGEEIDVLLLEPDSIVRRRYVLEGESGLGSLIESEVSAPVGERTVVALPRRPAAGEWGQSMYPDMLPAAVEITRRLSLNSKTLNEHSDPLLVLRRDPRAVPMDIFTPDSPADAAMRFSVETFYLNGWRRGAVGVLPEEYIDATYVTWDAQMQPAFRQIEEVENVMFAATAMPAALHGVLRGGAVNSGQALRRVFAPTYVHLRTLQESLKPRVAQACRVAALAAGHSVAEKLEVEWDNPLDRLDEQRIVQGDRAAVEGDTEEEPIPESADIGGAEAAP